MAGLDTSSTTKWHFPDLETHVVLVFLYPAQQAWHKGGRRGKMRREFHADEAAQRDVGVLDGERRRISVLHHT